MGRGSSDGEREKKKGREGGKKGKQSFCLFLAGEGAKIVHAHPRKSGARVSFRPLVDVLIKTDEPPGGLMTPVEPASDYRYNVPLESIGILFLIAYRARMFSSLAELI